MGVPTSEVGYTSAITGRGDNEVHDGHVVALGEIKERKISAYMVRQYQGIKPPDNRGHRKYFQNNVTSHLPHQ
jgi:hypothetical protein